MKLRDHRDQRRFAKGEHMSNRRTRNRRQQDGEGQSPLKTRRGDTSVSDSVVSEVAGIATQEVEGVQMGGGTSSAVGGFIDSVIQWIRQYPRGRD